MRLVCLASIAATVLLGCDDPHAFSDDVHVRTPESLAQLTGVREIHGNLFIRCEACDSLDDLGDLRTLAGGLLIEGNTQLTDLSGLEELSIGGGLRISSNPKLADISQLAHSQPNEVNIHGNDSIVVVAGFNDLTEARVVTISANLSLKTISGFHRLESIEDTLTLLSNPALADAKGFAQLRSAGEIRILGNPSLQNVAGLFGVERVERDLNLGQLDMCIDVMLRDSIGLENIGGLFPTDCSCPTGAWESLPENCN